MKKCFVISPIGREGSATREHADDVFDYIIQPAMEAREIQCRRSDHMHEPGKISEQMFREIFESDVCVALLTERNPNVFYELALAQAWNRPVIILIGNDEEVPFDIHDIRCVSYDLKPRNLFEKVFVNRLVAHLDSLDELGWKVPSPFGVLGNATQSSIDSRAPKFFDRYTRFGSSETWLETIAETSHRCDLLSLSLDSWKNRSGFSGLMETKAAAGCQIRLLQMHPENPMLVDHGSGTKTHEYVIPSIQLSAQFYRNLSMLHPGIQFRQILRGCTHSRIIILDQFAFVSPYLYGPGSSPLWQCDADSVLYHSLSSEFGTLWGMNDGSLPPP
ncbi:hypothetical protein SH528x_000447 [Novipirellula sp. SH528]|uniref:hypothetical protein n=1 Tax=Novipirellula sp. SH528 TaxID=3454466 RepID=UPI003F9F110B